MLIATELLSDDERAAAVESLPFRDDTLRLVGQLFGALKNQSIDLIDAALGPNHVRAAMVALYEAGDFLLEGCMELAESYACQSYFGRTAPIDPLRGGPLKDDESVARFPWRLARQMTENACTHAITAGDHLSNVHIRLAWEINAATETEVKICKFNPSDAEPRSWISVSDLQSGLREVEKIPLGVLKGFEPNSHFAAYMDGSKRARQYRNAIIHRDRPTYRELPAFGRVSLWAKDEFTIKFPAEPDEAPPPISTYREIVIDALAAALSYAKALWDLVIRWLRTIRVFIRPLPNQNRIEITTEQGRFAPRRDLRDPGPFVR